jgi:hypothetical protein
VGALARLLADELSPRVLGVKGGAGRSVSTWGQAKEGWVQAVVRQRPRDVPECGVSGG